METGTTIHTGFHAARCMMLCFLFLFLTACTDPETSKVLPPTQTGESPGSKETPLGSSDWKLPIKVPEGEFYKVFGWLDDYHLLYASNLSAGSNLYSYSLESGESKLVLASTDPIVTASTNPDSTSILVHSSPSSYEAVVSIYDMEGNRLVSQSFPSTELHAEWNLYDNQTALIVAFNEDWTFTSYKIDVSGNTVGEFVLPDPFAKWVGPDLLAYLKWDEQTPSFFAPVEVKELNGEVKASLDNQVYHIDAYKDLIVAVGRARNDETKAVYTFYNKQLESLGSFTVPHLTRFSDWLVPYQDYNLALGKLLVFEPVKSGEADSYTEGFSLASYEIDVSKKLLMEALDNQPIASSPNGKAVLYGYRFERIIELDSGKVLNLLDEKTIN